MFAIMIMTTKEALPHSIGVRLTSDEWTDVADRRMVALTHDSLLSDTF